MISMSVQCSIFQYKISFRRVGVTAGFATSAVILPSGLTIQVQNFYLVHSHLIVEPCTSWCKHADHSFVSQTTILGPCHRSQVQNR